MQHLHQLTDPQFLFWLSCKCVAMRYMYKIIFAKVWQIPDDLCLFTWCMQMHWVCSWISRASRVCIIHMRKLFQLGVGLIFFSNIELSIFIYTFLGALSSKTKKEMKFPQESGQNWEWKSCFVPKGVKSIIRLVPKGVKSIGQLQCSIYISWLTLNSYFVSLINALRWDTCIK